MDEVDRKQQDELDANRETDKRQQQQIDKLDRKSFWMMLMLVVNTVASFAQIVECFLVWKHRTVP